MNRKGPANSIDPAIVEFHGRSSRLFGWLHDLSRLPAMPLPKFGTLITGKPWPTEYGGPANQKIKKVRPHFRPMSDVPPEMAHEWRIRNPDLRGTVFKSFLESDPAWADDFMQHWFDLSEKARSVAKQNDLRVDIVNLANIIGWPERILSSAHRRTSAAFHALAKFAREPSGIGLREFDRCLSNLRRSMAVDAVLHSPADASLPESTSAMLQLDDVDRDILKCLAKTPDKYIKHADIDAGRERSVVSARIRNKLIPRALVRKLDRRKGVRITDAGLREISPPLIPH
jgi:hypothetical protein